MPSAHGEVVRRWLSVSLLLVLTFVLAEAVVGQSARPAATLDDLLAELRALRVELNEIVVAGIRAQMLVSRLSMQEQRIRTVADQLAAARQARLDGDNDYRARSAHLRRVEDSLRDGNPPPTQIRDVETMVAQLRQEVARSGQEQQVLQNREHELRRALSAEQDLWIELSSTLDALEHSLRTESHSNR